MHKTVVSASYANLSTRDSLQQCEITDITSIVKHVLINNGRHSHVCIFITSQEIQSIIPYINKIQRLPHKCFTFYVQLTSTSQLALIQQVCSTVPILYPSHLTLNNISHSLVTSLNTNVFTFYDELPSPNQMCPPIVGDVPSLGFQNLHGVAEVIHSQVGVVEIPDCQRMVVVIGPASQLLTKPIDSAIGVNTLQIFSPFPSSLLLRTTPKTVTSVCVVERMDDGDLGNLGPLYLQVVETFSQATDFPDTKLLSFTYQGNFTDAMVECIRTNMLSQSPQMSIHFTSDMQDLFPAQHKVSSNCSAFTTVLKQEFSNVQIWAINADSSTTQVQSAPSLDIGFGMLVAYLHRRRQFIDSVIKTINDPLFTHLELRDLLGGWISINSENCNTDPASLSAHSIIELLEQELYKFRAPTHALQEDPYGTLLRDLYSSREFYSPSASLWLVCTDSDTTPSSVLNVLQSGEKFTILVSVSRTDEDALCFKNILYELFFLYILRPTLHIGLYAITQLPNVYVASVALSESTAISHIRFLHEANSHNGPSLVIISYNSEWLAYSYDPSRSQIISDDEKVQQQLNSLLRPANFTSLVVQQEPKFQLDLADSLNAQMSTKFEKLLSSFSKLANGLCKPILVLYGSDGGVGEAMARKLHSLVEKKGLEVKCLACNELPFEEANDDQTIIFVISTSGQGKFPLNAAQFWKRLTIHDDISTLNRLRFAVFGLGDSQFWQAPLGTVYFCKPAKDLDRKLAALGAIQLLPLCCGDDQAPGGPEESFSTWAPFICKAIGVQIEPNISSQATTRDEDGADEVKQLDEDSKKALTNLIRERGLEMGLSAIAFTRLEKSECGATYEEWIAKGYHGEMGYLSREDAVQKRKNPTLLVSGALSAIVATINYDPGLDPAPFSDPSKGIFARYAQGEDYHDILKPKLMKLQQFIQSLPQVQSSRARVYVDTGPILERELARKAGIGWFGKNTMMIMPKRGSYFFLGVLLIDLDLDLRYDQPFTKDLCGGCSACLPACPTGALLGKDPVSGAPVMDARKCISYLTIEQKGPIPRELRKLIGNRIYGCDICQEACPWNQYSTPTTEPAFAARGLHGEKLVELLRLSQTDFSKKFKGSAIKRTKRRGLLRNVAVALGNWRNPSAIPHLIDALGDEEPLVRGHSAWALGQIGGPLSGQALQDRLEVEGDHYVQDEVSTVLIIYYLL